MKYTGINKNKQRKQNPEINIKIVLQFSCGLRQPLSDEQFQVCQNKLLILKIG